MGILLHFGGPVADDVPTTVESISILDGINDDVEIEMLSVHFDDRSPFRNGIPTVLHQEVLERIFEIVSSKRLIKTMHIINNGFHEVTIKRCFDFMLRCLVCPGGRIEHFGCVFEAPVSLTVPDATRFAATLLQSNNNLESLVIGPRNFTFSVKNTFEILFSAVLDRGIPCLVVDSATGRDYNTLIRRACSAGNSKLATNTTLKQLEFLKNGLSVNLTDDDINPISKVLKTNTGLEYIEIDGTINLSNTGVRNLMDGVRDNSSLTYGPVLSFPNDDRHNHLQSSIPTQINMNKFWKNFTTKYKVIGNNIINNNNNNNNDDDDLCSNHDGNINNDDDEIRDDDDDDDNDSRTSIVLPNKNQSEKEPPKTIALCMYSRLLYDLTAKPQFLFQFLKSESPLLFGHQDGSSNIGSVASNDVRSIENGSTITRHVMDAAAATGAGCYP